MRQTLVYRNKFKNWSLYGDIPALLWQEKATIHSKTCLQANLLNATIFNALRQYLLNVVVR